MQPNPMVDRVRYLAGGGVALAAIGYLLIAIDVVTVVEGQATTDATPLYIAAGLFAVLAVALMATPSRAVYATGAALQLLVIVGYLLISSDRTPAFETWGITLKILQIALLAALIYLMTRPTPRDAVGPRRRAGRTKVRT